MENKIKFEKTKAHQRYKLPDGTVVPGVTTVLGILNKPALLAWAWKLGTEGIDFRKAKDQAADIGTIAHWLIECHLTGVEPDMADFAPNDLSRAENAVIKFMSWWDASKFTLVSSEQQLVASVEPYFGGTLDIMAKDADGKIALIDLKTSKAIYPEYFQQVAAYGELYEQNRNFDTTIHEDAISRYIICRVGKEETGDFEVQERADLKRELNIFMKCLELYKALREIKTTENKNKQKGKE